MPAKAGVKPLKKLSKGMGLYQVVYWPNSAPDKSKPWAVVNLQTRDVNGRWHESKEKASAQAKALYARLGNKARYGMSEKMQYVLIPIEFSEKKDNLLWVEALPAKTWHTKAFGEVTVTPETLNRMIENFRNNVRGQEVATNYEHGMDRAKGEKASGWYRDFDIRDGSLWAGIELTPTAEREVKDGEWKYFSLEWDDFIHPETQELYKDVIVGGALTNVPVAKGLVPINFSELFEFAEKKKPYGDVTYADPGYRDNKKRYPLDTEKHIRAAWSYINMPKNASKYSSSQVSSIKSKIKAAMRRIGAKVSMSEVSEEAIEKELNDNLMAEDEAVAIVEDSSVPEEHAEPGEPPDPTLNEDDSFPDRHLTLPEDNDEDDTKTNQGGKEVELEKLLREKLGLGDDADIIKAVTDLQEEVGPLREVAKQFSEKKAFSEAYPEQAKELEELKKERIANESKKFSEKYGEKKLLENKGLSALSVEKVQNVHRAFSERALTLADLEELLDTITGDKGLVEFGERGSSQVDTERLMRTDAPNARIAFSELVADIMEKDELEYEPAVKEAAKRDPELYENYRKPVRA